MTFVILRPILILMVFLWAFMSAGAVDLVNSKPGVTDHPERIIIKINPSLKITPQLDKSGKPTLGVPAVDSLLKGYEISSMESLCNLTNIRAGHGDIDNIMILDFSDPGSAAEFMASVPSLDEVSYAQIDYGAKLYDTPDDPLYAQQWYLDNTSQSYYTVEIVEGCNNDVQSTTSGTPDADIDAGEVLSNPPSNTVTVVVGIIDTGVDMDHPDLTGKIWINSDEIPSNGIDDDHNGYVDDINGWDFSGAGMVPPVEDNDPTDTFGHGTHCAGIIGAVTDNGTGIAGIADDCRIMPLKFYPILLSSSAARAVIYAADNGADVISMSFGYPWPVPVLADALAYARSKGVICCAASGNDGIERSNYPAATPGIITVGASTSTDLVASFSTYGPFLDFVAPGTSILSLRAGGTDMYSDCEPNVHIVDTDYYLADGTSMACPVVVGTIAGLLAEAPGLTEAAAKSALIASVFDIVQPYDSGNYPGWDKYSGYGRVDYNDARQQLPNLRAKITGPDQNEIISGSVPIYGIADGSDFSNYVLEYGSGPNPDSWQQIAQSSTPVTDGSLGSWNTLSLNGQYTIRLRNGASNRDQVTVYVVNGTMASMDNIHSTDTLDVWTYIMGSAICPAFKNYVIEYQALSPPSGWQTIVSSSIPVVDNLLAEWNPVNLDEGDYNLRLTVNSQSGVEATVDVDIYVRSIFASDQAWKVSLPYDLSPMANYGDFDNDGVNEIVVSTSQGVKFFDLDGNEKTEGMPVTPTYDDWIPIAVGDLDGDRIDDFVTIDKLSSGRLFGYPSSEPSFNVNLVHQPDYSQVNNGGEQYYPYLALKDIDGDGRDEIITGTGGTTPYYVIYNSDGSFKYEMNQSYTGFYLFFSLDVTGDNEDEFFMAGSVDMGQASKPYGFLIKRTGWLSGQQFQPFFITAADVDYDGQREIIVFGPDQQPGGHYWIYAFEGDLSYVPGWPHDTGLDNDIITSPVYFGDVDTDGTLEYFLTMWELSNSNVFAWHDDGSAVMGDSLLAVFCGPDNPSILRGPMIADISGDGFPDIVTVAAPDLFGTYNITRLVAWDRFGDDLPGFPIVTVPGGECCDNHWVHTPVIGDINKDGHVDMVLTTGANDLIFINFENSFYHDYTVPVSTWKYNRRLNGLGPVTSPDFVCGDCDHDGQVNLVDILYLINYRYGSPPGPSPVPQQAGDVNDDGDVNLIDILYLIDFVYGAPHGPAPNCGE